MPTIVLNTSNDELLGFLLIAGDESISSGAKVRECVFTGVPRDSSLWDLPASQFLQTNKNQEFVLTLDFDQDVPALSVSLNDVLKFHATIAETKDGTWYFVSGGIPTEVGRCKWL